MSFFIYIYMYVHIKGSFGSLQLCLTTYFVLGVLYNCRYIYLFDILFDYLCITFIKDQNKSTTKTTTIDKLYKGKVLFSIKHFLFFLFSFFEYSRQLLKTKHFTITTLIVITYYYYIPYNLFTCHS